MAKRKHTCDLKSLRYMKIILSTIITLSLFGVIIYWKRLSIWTGAHQIWNSTSPPYKENLNRSSVCYNVLTQMRNARWIKRTNITPIDELQQRNTEIQIRKKRGMPIRLHRDDSRCGGDPFFLASPNFGFPLPALCDVNGSAPCCNHVTQRCGALHEDCNCARCTDFRKKISAELFDWIPFHGGCTFTNFTSEKACRLMSERISRLVLIGDSLVRHLFNALMILFTNDPERGSLKRNMEDCQGFMQFVDGGTTSCHDKTLDSIPQEKEQQSFCGGKYQFDFFLKEYYDIAGTQILATVRKYLNKERTIIAIGVGLHIDLSAEKIQREIIEPVLEMKNSSGTIWPYILWISIHAHGSLKDKNYNIPSHNDRIARFNLDMEKYLSAFGIPVFDTFNLTSGVRSIDGTHFGVGINMMKAQLFMNFLQEIF